MLNCCRRKHLTGKHYTFVKVLFHSALLLNVVSLLARTFLASSYVYSDKLSVTNNTKTSLLVDFTALLIFFLFFLSFSCLGAGCRPGRFYFVFTFCSLILFCFSAVLLLLLLSLLLLLLLLLWLFYSYSFLFFCHICGFYLQTGEAPCTAQ